MSKAAVDSYNKAKSIGDYKGMDAARAMVGGDPIYTHLYSGGKTLAPNVSTPGSITQGSTNSSISGPSALPAVIATTQNQQNSNVGKTLQEWATSRGGVGYDPTNNTVNIGGKKFASGSVPGTYLDPSTGRHIITDETALSNALNGSGDTMTSDSILRKVIEQLSAPQKEITLQDVMGQLPVVEQTPALTYDQALGQATESLSSVYDLKSRSLLEDLAADQMARGFYGQLPADVVTQEAMANLEAEKNSAIAELATQLVQQSEATALQRDSINSQNYNTQLNSLLKILMNNQSLAKDRLSSLIEVQDILSTKEASAIQAEYDRINEALSRIDVLGYADKTAASILGIPEGTPSNSAKQAALDRQQQLQLASMRSSGGGSGGGSGGLSQYQQYQMYLDELERNSTFISNYTGLREGLAAGKIDPNSAKAEIQLNYQYGLIDKTQYDQMMSLFPKNTNKGSSKSTTKTNDLSTFIKQLTTDISKGKYSNPMMSQNFLGM